MKIIFDNALAQKVEEIYVTIFETRDEQRRLITLLEEWGFQHFGYKSPSGELVYVRDFKPHFNLKNLKSTYPYIGLGKNIFLVPIYPEYHTELMPDSILHTESKANFIDHEPHRNSIGKVYISRSWEKDINAGDIIVFYRTGGYYKSVVTTIGIIDKVYFNFENEADFVNKCRKRSVFTDEKLKEYWNFNSKNRPFLVNFLYVYSFPNRINLKRLIELEVIKDLENVPRGFQRISKEMLIKIIKDTNSDESIIID
ncbi:EVE domain-containing protein [Mucilaginibacter sp. 21P]|uniref:EVE domain-containing protein n=1 Tax=Mucilaginibacter sp. 21P TaxID=2778902 RepID=UPI001C5A2A14|nr:EVE domain-containing protein [Mucilaginibacter sp. 21P]